MLCWCQRIFPEEALDTLNKGNTILPSHTDRLKTPGVDISTGSLGQGASLAAGAALADKIDGKTSYTYMILGDGELDEGQVWESALFAAHHKLDHLITFVDVMVNSWMELQTKCVLLEALRISLGHLVIM